MTKNLPPCPRLVACSNNMAERAFRRGYQHGWLFALNALEDGATPEEAKQFAMSKLQAWRYNRATAMIEPPEFERGRP